MHQERRDPRDTRGVEEVEEHPAATGLATDGRKGRHAGEIEQNENHEPVSHSRGEDGLSDVRARTPGVGLQTLLQGRGVLVGIRIAVVEHAHGGDHNLLGGETRDEGDPHLPVEAEGTEDRRDEPTELSDVGVLNLAGRTVELQLRNLRLPLALRQGGVRPYPLDLRRVTIDLRSGVREILQRPNDDGGHQDDRTHLLEVLHALVPHVNDGVAEGRDTVGRQLHYELVALLLEGRLFDNQRGDNGHHHPEKVDGGEDQPLMFREEGGNEEQIDG